MESILSPPVLLFAIFNLKGRCLLPAPMSDSSLALLQIKAALEEAQNISTTSSLQITLFFLDKEKTHHLPSRY